MGNLDIWDKLRQPPATALKKIQAGRLKGMSDINPQWRYRVMTETFGPVGIGWMYTIDRLWTEQGSQDQVFAFASISVYIKQDGVWSDAIPGQGGSMLVTKENAGLHSSDEGYKMAITDALSVALKMLGVAADIYMGLWDGSKYKDEPINGYADICAALSSCTTMEELQAKFSEAWGFIGNDMEGRRVITAAKDKRKLELSNATGDQ